MQRRTRTTLFLKSNGLLKQSTFVILEKITRVANNTWYIEIVLWVLMTWKIVIGHGLSCCNGGHIAIFLDCRIEIRITCIWLQWYLLYIYLLAKIVALLSQNLLLLTPNCVTFNLARTISNGSYGIHVVIYIPVISHWRCSTISWSL